MARDPCTLVASGIDVLLDASVVAGFSRIGYLVRRSVFSWTPPPVPPGRVAVVTGASSGIGLATAKALSAGGGDVVLVGRDEERTEVAAASIRSEGGTAEAACVDLSDGGAVDAFAERFAATRGRLDVLVHSAGALLAEYHTGRDGVELTVATHVLGPYRLTWRLSSRLRAAGAAVVVTISSGGMYTERFDLDGLELRRDEYDGVRAYARAKRAQVVLAGEWRRRWSLDGVASYSMHPGWVNTAGLRSGLPTFARLGPLLRTPEEGADTAVWLASGAARGRPGAGQPGSADGFWHDRRPRREYRLPWTRPREGPLEEGRQLWEWCARRTGVGPA